MITHGESKKYFRFGEGVVFKSQGLVKIPVVIGRKKVTLETNVVDSHIPLLLSNN